MTDKQKVDLVAYLDVLSEEINEETLFNGHWDNPDPLAKLALIHSSVSSAVEGEAMGLGVDYVKVALVEIVTRVLDYAYHYDYDLSQAIADVSHEGFIHVPQ